MMVAWISGKKCSDLAKTTLDSGSSQLPCRSNRKQLLKSPEEDKDTQEAEASGSNSGSIRLSAPCQIRRNKHISSCDPSADVQLALVPFQQQNSNTICSAGRRESDEKVRPITSRVCLPVLLLRQIWLISSNGTLQVLTQIWSNIQFDVCVSYRT